MLPTASFPSPIDLISTVISPLTMQLTDPLATAIGLMGSRGDCCNVEDRLRPHRTPQRLRSCLFVLEQEHLVGRVAERQLLSLWIRGDPERGAAIAPIMVAPGPTLPESEIPDFFSVLTLLSSQPVPCLPLVNSVGGVVGAITPESLRPLLCQMEVLRVAIAADVMTPTVVAAIPTMTLLEVAHLLVTQQVGVVVIQESWEAPLRPLGLVTEQDLVQLLALGIDLATVQVQTILGSGVPVSRADTSLWSVQQLMQDWQSHYIVVTDGTGSLLGLVTQTALLAVLNPVTLGQIAMQLADERDWLAARLQEADPLLNRIDPANPEMMQRRRAEYLLELQNSLLERIARAEPLLEILTALIAAMETQLAESCCSIMLCDTECKLHPIATASLPESYLQAIDGILVAEGAGSCGTAAFRQQPVLVADIATDPLWQDYRDLIQPYGLQACWSIPICSSTGGGLGTFAVYYPTCRIPQAAELDYIMQAANIAGIAIEQDQVNQALTQLHHELEQRVAVRTTDLLKSEQRYRGLIDNASDAILLANVQGNLIEVNQKAVELLGYSQDELMQMTVQQIHPPEVMDAVRQHFTGVIGHNQGPVLETLVMCKNGTTVPVDITASRIELDGQYIAQGIIRDVRDRKQAEQQLHRLSERLELALKSAQVGIWEWDCATNQLLWDDRMCALYGIRREDFTGQYHDWMQRVHPEDLAHELDLQTQAMQGERSCETEFRIVHPDGTVRYISSSALIQRNQQGEPQRVIGLNIDITDRKLADQENQRLKDRLQFVLSSNPAVIFTCHPTGDYGATFVSENVLTVTGYSATEFLAESNFWADHLHPEDAPEVFAQLSQLFEVGQHTHEYRFRHQLGHYLWVRNELRIVRDQSGNPLEIVGYFVDISDRKQAELNLQASQSFIQKIADASPNILYLYDLQTQCNLYVNQAITLILGYTSEEIQAMGHGFLELMHPTDLNLILPAYHNRMILAQDGEVIESEYRLRHASGGWRWLHSWDMVFSRNPDGVVQQIIGTAQDITERKQAEVRFQQQADREHLTNVISQHIRQSLDLQQVLNTTVAEIYHVLQVERVLVCQQLPDGCGQAIAEAVSPGWPVLLHQIFSAEIFPQEIHEQLPQGHVCVLSDQEMEPIIFCLAEFGQDQQVQAELAVAIVHHHHLWGLLIVHQCSEPRTWQTWEMDLLQQLSRQLAIAIHQSELYTQLRRGHDQLSRVNTELLRATQLKDEFLANMSHELRTPLNAILGMSETLLEQIPGPLNQKQHRLLDTIEQSGQHLLSLINDILDVSKIEAGKLDLEITLVSINHLCHSSLAFIKQIAFKKQIHISSNLTAEMGDIAVDERRMRQVLINLLSNAVKFTPTHGQVTLVVRYDPCEIDRAEQPLLVDSETSPVSVPPWYQQAGCCLTISVIDTGIGIAPDDQARLFQPFFQVESHLSRQYEGTGLGLALARQIIELHGGDISVTSQLGEGSCFTIRLPALCPIPDQMVPAAAAPLAQLDRPSSSRGEPDLPPLPHTLSPPVEPHNPVILLAEDNPANILTLSAYLEAKGYTLLLAQNGQEALNWVQTQKPDLILMDIQMPGMDGLEAIQCIRQDATLTQVPIIALTALAMPGDRERCLQAGATHYLAKPVVLKELDSLIQQLLRQS